MSNVKENTMNWYMVRVATNKENKAIENFKNAVEIKGLERFVEEYFFPREKKVFLRNNKKVESEKPMFPGYILVKMNPIGEIDRLVKETNFLVEIMGNSGTPQALKQSEVDRIFGNVEISKSKIEFIKDEEVVVTDGPFKNFNGIVTSVDGDKQRVTVEVMVFGRSTPLELNFTQIDKTSV